MKYFIGFLLSIGLIVLVFVLILRGFSGKKTDTTVAPLTDYANTQTVVRLTTDGKIVADQEHQAYQITVGRDQTLIETFQGYEYMTLNQKSYANNQQGYFNFLRALDLAGFTKGSSKSVSKDERGVCSQGQRYIMEILNGSSSVQRYWTTSCKGGTFKGSTQTVRQLFKNQIPAKDFPQLTGKLNL